MKKTFHLIALMALVLGLVGPSAAFGAVTATAGPTSLVIDPVLLKASSVPLGLFEVTLSADAGETLTSVSVTVDKANASTTVASADLANVAVYKDDGNGVFNSSVDILVGTQTTVNIAGASIVSAATATPATGKFFVSLSSSGTWSDVSPADSVKVTLPDNGIVTTAGTLALSAATITNTITADTTGPVLSSAIAKNTGGTAAKEAGDSVELTFSEPTNKPAVTSSTIATLFSLSSAHSFLDTTGNLGATTWSVDGKVLTIVLSGTTTPTSTLPTVAVSDIVSVVTPSIIADLAGNTATGSQTITGNFAGSYDDDDDDLVRGKCANSLINGRLYKIAGSPTVYLAAACRLKPFRGAAVFHARGKKFLNIIELPSLPENVTISQKPVLPTAGALIKGSDKTVWFMGSHGKRKGFVSANVFARLGFDFKKIKIISDSDLALIPVDTPVQENSNHPDGAIIKCSNAAAVYQVIGGKKFPFASMQALENAGGTVDAILIVNCGQFTYTKGAPVQ